MPIGRQLRYALIVTLIGIAITFGLFQVLGMVPSTEQIGICTEQTSGIQPTMFKTKAC